ncbi:hypothetical protein ARMSODRAFT_739837 [Armillaria solidipes]|uniref:Uncharacterized protein n=1 Tax=Armillaria solidipes TaxID=1076256 RepID=A0A2H3AYZ8_9AGAR|nr:hypothetical protein ARMSODRAFT_739837 [Armillaria solidipes]
MDNRSPVPSIHDNIVHTPRGDIRAKHVHKLPMVGRTISSSQSRRYRSRARPVQRAGTGLDDGWLVRGRLCCAQARLRIGLPGGIEMGTQSFFDAVGCADDSQVEFRVSAYLGDPPQQWTPTYHRISSLVLHRPRDFRHTRHPLPPLPAHHVQIAVLSTGLCSSDLHYYIRARNGAFAL